MVRFGKAHGQVTLGIGTLEKRNRSEGRKGFHYQTWPGDHFSECEDVDGLMGGHTANSIPSVILKSISYVGGLFSTLQLVEEDLMGGGKEERGFLQDTNIPHVLVVGPTKGRPG